MTFYDRLHHLLPNIFGSSGYRMIITYLCDKSSKMNKLREIINNIAIFCINIYFQKRKKLVIFVLTILLSFVEILFR